MTVCSPDGLAPLVTMVHTWPRAAAMSWCAVPWKSTRLAPGGHDGQLAAGLTHVLDDVGGEQDGAVAGQLGEQVAEADALFRIEPGGGLVHDQELGIVE